MSAPDRSNYTRVTEALYFLSGLQGIPKEVVAKAAARGTAVDTLCKADILGLPQPSFIDLVAVYAPDDIDSEVDKVTAQYNSYLWWKKDKSGFIIPDRWYCDQHQLTGEGDSLLPFEDGYDLIDYKTPANESQTWQLQGSAYWHLGIINRFKIKRIRFVKLAKNGKAPKEYFYEPNFEEYLKVLHVHRKYFKDKPQLDVLDYL